MKAFIPNKDTLFFLADIQKKILGDNSSLASLYPAYPCYAFFEDLPQAELLSAALALPCTSGDEIIIPLELTFKDNHIEHLKITIGKITGPKELKELCISEEIKKAFPRKERIFRMATVIQENNGWKIHDDRWIKII
ncbi:MAG: hypothetical protein KBS64_05440 [Treponema sp.]|nr:hypothetical protein [Candidatus Treponema equi]